MAQGREGAGDGLPPGQVKTGQFPVTGEQTPLADALDPQRWRLVLDGLLARPRVLSWEEFLGLPQEDLTADIHCVTGWSHLGMRLTGVRLARLLEPAGVDAAARYVRFEAYSSRGHDTSLPLAVALADTWLIRARDGRPLEPEHGGPLRTVTPSRYFYKSLKWVRRIELLAEDRLGYWERESRYHNNGDWRSGQERYTTGALKPERLAAFRTARDYDRYRGPANLLLSVDLRGWAPASRDLRELYVKNSDLREAELEGADLRGANLTRCDLRGARLAGALLAGADLEGANLAGADLRGADLRGAALSATIFVEPGPDGVPRGALVAGMMWDGAAGLLEAQEEYLRAAI